MENTWIVTGGNISKEFLKEQYKAGEVLIAVDRGLEIVDALGIVPQHILGDFDSVDKEILRKYEERADVKIHPYIPEKDDTDTELAIKLAIQLESMNIIILGGIGSRMDHVLANIHVMTQALGQNIPCMIEDEKNRIRLIDRNIKLKRKEIWGKYISLIPFTEKVTGVTLRGLKYPLEKATLEIGKGIGISNEMRRRRGYDRIKRRNFDFNRVKGLSHARCIFQNGCQ